MGIFISILLPLACVAAVLVVFIPYMLMFNNQMKVKYEGATAESLNKGFVKSNLPELGSLTAFVICILIFIIYFSIIECCDNYIFIEHDWHCTCWEHMKECNISRHTRLYYTMMYWIYFIFKVFHVLYSVLTLLRAKHRYAIKSVKFVPSIILFSLSLIATSVFVHNHIVMPILGALSIIFYTVAAVLYGKAVKDSKKVQI